MMHRCRSFALLCSVYISFVATQDYNIGEPATLLCTFTGDEPVNSIAWHFNFGTPSEFQVATWKFNTNPKYTGQWEHRTELNTHTGKLDIQDLELRDDGTYTCRYDAPPTDAPSKDGGSHSVSIRGKYRIEIKKINMITIIILSTLVVTVII